MEEEIENITQIPAPDSDNIAEEATSPSIETDNLAGLTDLEVKLAESQDKYLRLSAEFDNYRKRTLKEKYELIKTASEDVIKDLLTVIDDFDRALIAVDESKDLEALQEGLKLVYTKLNSVLAQKGLKEIEALHQTFDPEIYEAIANAPAPDELKAKVILVIQKGYQLNEKVIRHPKVIVGE